MATDDSSAAFGASRKEAERLNAELARVRREANLLVQQEGELTKGRGRVRTRLEEESRRGRVGSDTVVSEDQARRGRGSNVREEARAQQQAARVQQTRSGAIRSEQQALANLTRTRESDLRSVQRMARQGPYAGIRNLSELQLQASRLQNLRASAQTGVTPILTGGGAGRPPSGGAPPTGPGGAGGGGRPPYDRAAYAETMRGARSSAAAIEQWRSEESRLIQVMGQGNPTIRRHGALTTEFFQEAARGTVTIRELGFQTAATIGKFSGWLGAGAAIFGVLGAIQNLASGALDAQGGVNDLQRVLNNVDASKLRGQFRDLSQHFNVPIKDAADAVYQMGKVFKDQDQAVSAAGTALYAVKIGELDVASATRYLTAIIQGANLSADDMKTVFDQVNYAQNQFGVSIEGTLQGLAKASGSFRNAGGDINQLLALIALGQKITGQTGDVQGTAFQRIPNYLNQANNQATLRQFGINPGGNVTDILNQAIQKSASGKLDRDQVRQLATSIFGKFYGPRVGVPLLNNPARAQQYITQLRPGGPSRGSGEKELQTLLGSIQERIKAIGTQLQILGDNLTGTHLLDFFGLVVVALGQALKFTNFLVTGFDQLPDGVKRTLSYLLEGLIVLRAMQRLQVGELIAPAGGGSSARRQRIGNFLGTGETPANQVRLTRRAQALETTHFQEQFTQATSQGLDATNRGRIAQQQLLAAQEEHAKLLHSGVATADEEARSQRRMSAFAYEADAAQRDMARAEVSRLSAAQSLQQTQARAATSARRFRQPGSFFPFFGRDNQAILDSQAGRYRPSTAQVPTAVPPTRVQGPLTESQSRAQAAARQAVAEGRALGQAAVSGGVAVAQVNQSMQGAEAQANRTRAGTAGLRGRLGTFRGAFGGVLGGFGNILFAASIVFFASQELNNVIESLGSTFDDIESNAPATAKNAADLKAKLQATQQAAGQGVGVVGQTLNDLKASVFGADPQKIAGDELKNYAQRLSLQNQQRRRGAYIPLLRADEISPRIKGLTEVAKNEKKFEARIRTIRQEIASGDLGAGEVKALQAQLEATIGKVAVAARPKTLQNRLKNISDPKVLSGLIDAQGDLVKLGQKQHTIQRARLIYERMVKLLGDSHNPADIKQLAEARGKMLDLIQQQAQQQLSTIQARGAVTASRISGTTNPVQRQQAELATLRQQIQFMRSHRKAFKLSDILGLQAQINDAETQLADTIRQQAQDVAHAQFDVARAQAGNNDVKTARIDIQQAQYDAAHAQTTAERLQARADLINSRRQLQENIANRQIEDIQFQADIGKLTLSQQIESYRRLLKTAELTRDQRRDLKRRIYQLNQQTDSEAGGFELAVGNIKLPTVYEIKRAIGGGYGQGSSVSVNNAPNINVYAANPQAAAAVGAAIDNSLGTATQAAMKNAGMIG